MKTLLVIIVCAFVIFLSSVAVVLYFSAPESKIETKFEAPVVEAPKIEPKIIELPPVESPKEPEIVIPVVEKPKEPMPEPPIIPVVELEPVIDIPKAKVSEPVEPPKDEVIAHDITYEKAYEIAVASKRPLVVVVGAEWCGPCQQLKRTVLPNLLLGRKILVKVDQDKEGALAGKITTGPIPQIIRYRYDEKTKGWLRSKLVGLHSVQEVQKFVDEE